MKREKSDLSAEPCNKRGPVPEDEKKKADTSGFATRSNYYAPDDLVWVHPAKGYPLWPAEVLESANASGTVFRCRLFAAPTLELKEVSVPAARMLFFDKLSDQAEIEQVIEERLQRDKHSVAAYEERFRAAVSAANALAGVVLAADRLWQTPRHAVVCKPVGVVHCYHRTHTSAPRQPHTKERVQDAALGVIRCARGFENALRDLKGFERVWITFHFSYATKYSDIPDAKGFSAMVVPPRDSVARGVFATRSPHRPNPIGLSCVRLVDVRGLDLHIADHDLLHGTPVLDIKPYLPFCDAHPQAKAGWVDALERSGKAKGDHRTPDAPDVAIVRAYPQGQKPTTIDPRSGRVVDSDAPPESKS